MALTDTLVTLLRDGVFYLAHHYLLVLAALAAAYVVRLRYFHPLSKYPGPFMASLTPMWRTVDMWRGHQHIRDVERHRKYGRIFRDGPNSIVFSDPKAMDAIYGTDRTQSPSQLVKSKWYWSFSNFGDRDNFNVFAMRFPKDNAAMRRRLQQVFSMTNILQYEDAIGKVAQDWLDCISGGKDDVVVDFGDKIHFFTLDVVFSVGFGKRITTPEVYLWRKVIMDLFWFAAMVGPLHGLLYIMKMRAVGSLINPNPKDKTGYGFLMGYAEREIDRRIKHGNVTGQPHLLNSFASLVTPESEKDNTVEPFLREHAIGEALSPLAAGSDTTGISITTSIFHIAKYPRVQELLYQEIREFEEKGLLSTPAAYAQAVAMPYLQACIKEATRVYPSFGGTFPREIPAHGRQILPDVWVPGNIDVGACYYVMQRNTAIFGDDAEHFRPERWLPWDCANTKNMEKYHTQFGFTLGSRPCLGRNLALTAINKAVLEVFRNFQVALEKPDMRLEDIDVCYTQIYLVRKLPMRFTRRKAEV